MASCLLEFEFSPFSGNRFPFSQCAPTLSAVHPDVSVSLSLSLSLSLSVSHQERALLCSSVSRHSINKIDASCDASCGGSPHTRSRNSRGGTRSTYK